MDSFLPCLWSSTDSSLPITSDLWWKGEVAIYFKTPLSTAATGHSSLPCLCMQPSRIRLGFYLPCRAAYLGEECGWRSTPSPDLLPSCCNTKTGSKCSRVGKRKKTTKGKGPTVWRADLLGPPAGWAQGAATASKEVGVHKELAQALFHIHPGMHRLAVSHVIANTKSRVDFSRANNS